MITLDQFIIELHQDEILNLKMDIIKHLIESCKILNDLRTIFLVHDKRILSILSKDEILSDYLSKRHHDTIKKHRIKTILSEDLRIDLNLRNTVVNNKQDWVIKPCMSGKGKGILFGKNMSQDKWCELIEELFYSDQFILQEYVKQQKFNFVYDKETDECLVGTLLCLNDKFLGPGLYRASNKDLVAFSQGGFMLFPLQASKKSLFYQDHLPPVFNNHKPFLIPKKSIFELNKYSFKDCDKYKYSLINSGLVLIKCCSLF